MTENNQFDKASTGASREKLNQAPYDLVPFQEITDAYTRVAEFGAVKYEPWNWSKGLARVQLCCSLLRHTFAYLRGEETDADSGLSHTDHILWNAAALSHNVHWGLEDGRRAEPPRSYKELIFDNHPEAPDHPWDHMSPVEQLADWLGADVDELAEITDPVRYPIPVRASPDTETLDKAMTSLECVVWHDAFEQKMVVASTSEDFIVVDEDDDPWAPALEAMALLESGPEFTSKRTVAGQVAVTETSVGGATTIINIENVYLTDKD